MAELETSAADPSPGVSRMPPPPFRQYRVQKFSGSDLVGAYWVEFLPDWLVFHVDYDDPQKVLAYPNHYVRGRVEEVYS